MKKTQIEIDSEKEFPLLDELQFSGNERQCLYKYGYITGAQAQNKKIHDIVCQKGKPSTDKLLDIIKILEQ